MAKEDLKTKLLKSLNSNVVDIRDTMRDLSMKLCYLIKKDKGKYSMPENINYENSY